MSSHSIHLQDNRIILNYPYIVFGGNLCGLKNVFDSSMVNEPSGFEPLKFYCSLISHHCPNEETLHPWLSRMHPLKILIKLFKCTG